MKKTQSPMSAKKKEEEKWIEMADGIDKHIKFERKQTNVRK